MGRRSGYQRKQNAAERWMELLVGCFVAVYLLAVKLPDAGNAGYTALSPLKTTLFYVLAGLLVCYGLIRLCLELRQARQKRQRLRPPSAAQYAALAFLGCTLLSAAFSATAKGNPWYDPTAHEAALTVALYVLLFLVVSRWGVATERLFRVLFWSMALFCLLCLLQALGGNPLGLYPKGLCFYDVLDNNGRTGTHAGPIGNVDLVSAFLALATPMLLLHTLGQPASRAWPCWVLAAACLGVLIWINVLCGLVGLALGAAVIWLVLCPDRWRKRVLLLYLGLGFGGLALLWLVDLPLGFLHELHEILHGNLDDKFGTGRFFIWRQMLARVPDRLWTGVGPDMARYSGLEPFIRRDALGNIVLSASGKPYTASISDAHCYPLQILYCQGLPALLAWLGTVGLTLGHWYKARRDRAAALLGGGLVCFLFAMLFSFSSVIIMPFFWLTMGLLEARYRQLGSASGCSLR